MKLNLFIILIVVATIVSYANIFANDFAWDDTEYLGRSKTFSSALEFFTKDDIGIYRPIRAVLFFFMYKISGLNPFGYHLFSLIIHSLNSIIIYLIIKKLFNQNLAFFSSLLFAVHPIHIGKVTFMTGNFDLVGILFYLLAFYFYISKKYSYSIPIFILGLFTNEEVYTLPLLIILYDYLFKRKTKSIPYFIILAVFLFLRIFVLNIGARVSEYPGGNVIITFLTMPKILLTYISLIFFPFGLTPFRRIDFVTSLNISFIIPLLLIIAFFILLYKVRNKTFLFFTGWFFITMLPFLNIAPLQKIMAERYMYMASLSILVGIAAFFVYLKPKFKYAYFVFAIILISFSGLTLYHNTFWKNELTLMSRGIFLNPNDAKAHNNLGVYYYDNGNYERAVYHYIQAIDSDKEYEKPYTNLGVLYAKINQPEDAIIVLRKAISLEPTNYKAYSMLGALYFNTGNVTLAETYIRRALEINPDYEEAKINLALLKSS